MWHPRSSYKGSLFSNDDHLDKSLNKFAVKRQYMSDLAGKQVNHFYMYVAMQCSPVISLREIKSLYIRKDIKFIWNVTHDGGYIDIVFTYFHS